MRNAFTLIELMIVIAIIAIIAAIAVPNLLESRINANESAAAASLKSGFFPAQTQFQSGGYSDSDSDGLGEYTDAHQNLAGFQAGGGGIDGIPTAALSLMSPSWNDVDVTTEVNGYYYDLQTFGYDPAAVAKTLPDGTTLSQADCAERWWTGAAGPIAFGDSGRRAFIISQDGMVGASAGARLTSEDTSITEVALDTRGTGAVNGDSAWDVGDACIASGNLVTTEYVPFKK